MLTKLASDSTRADVLIDGADQMLYAAKVEVTIAIDRAEATHAVTVMLQIAGLITVLSVLVAVALLTVAVAASCVVWAWSAMRCVTLHRVRAISHAVWKPRARTSWPPLPRR